MSTREEEGSLGRGSREAYLRGRQRDGMGWRGKKQEQVWREGFVVGGNEAFLSLPLKA